MNNQQGQAFASVASAVSSGLNGLPYSPALLLDGRFDASITDGFQFYEACQDGYGRFFEEIDEGDEVSMHCSFTWNGVEEMVTGNMVRRYDARELAYECLFGSHPPLSWRAGFMLGWLSALASINVSLAWRGVGLLALLVRTCRTEESKRVA